MNRLLRLLSVYRAFHGWMALGVLAALATLLANVALMATSGWFITAMAMAGAAHVSMNYFTPAALIRAAAMVRTGGRYLERLVTHAATLRLLAALRTWFYARLEPLAPAALQRHHSADLMSRLRADVDTLDNLYLRLLVPAITALLATLLFTLFLVTYDPALALALLACLALGGILLPGLALRLADAPGQARVALLARQRSLLVDGIQGMPELVLYAGADAHAARVQANSAALVQTQARVARTQGLSQAGLLLAGNLAAWSMLWLAIPLVENGSIGRADLAMLALFALAALEAVAPLPGALQSYGATRAAAQRLFEVVDTPPPVTEPAAPSPQPQDFGLRLQGVTFGYPSARDAALSDIDLEIPAGSRLTISGPSGAGKSTLLHLLLRFDDPSRGRILLGGEPLQRFHGDDVRRHFAAVSQHTHLFTATVADNLRLARPDASIAELDRACRTAGIHDTIAALPNGYDTWLGEAGSNLSGGQARRLAVARALLKDAPILLLDEPTEGLDPSTARQLLETLDRAAAGKTVILVTHQPGKDGRFGPVRRMDAGRLLPGSQRPGAGADAPAPLAGGDENRPARHPGGDQDPTVGFAHLHADPTAGPCPVSRDRNGPGS